jgi:hypothetical protein
MPLDFFLWGQMKSVVYETPVESVEDLIARITAAAEYIQTMPGIFHTVNQNMLRRCNVTKLVAVTSSSSCDQSFYIVCPVAPRGCIFGYGLSGKNDHP